MGLRRTIGKYGRVEVEAACLHILMQDRQLDTECDDKYELGIPCPLWEVLLLFGRSPNRPQIPAHLFSLPFESRMSI